MNLTSEEIKRRRVRLRDVYHGRPKSNDFEGPLFVYANLYDAGTDELIISADLDYIMRSIKEHKFILVK